MEILMIIVYVIFTTAGAMLMKAGAANPLALSLNGGKVAISAGWITLTGFALYFISFMMWTRLIATNELSWFVPVAFGSVQVVMMAGAIFIFREQVSAMRLIGAAIIVCGIIVMNIKGK